MPICRKTTETIPKPTISDTPFIGKLNKFLKVTSKHIRSVANIIAIDAAHADKMVTAFIILSTNFKDFKYILEYTGRPI